MCVFVYVSAFYYLACFQGCGCCMSHQNFISCCCVRSVVCLSGHRLLDIWVSFYLLSITDNAYVEIHVVLCGYSPGV